MHRAQYAHAMWHCTTQIGVLFVASCQCYPTQLIQSNWLVTTAARVNVNREWHRKNCFFAKSTNCCRIFTRWCACGHEWSSYQKSAPEVHFLVPIGQCKCWIFACILATNEVQSQFLLDGKVKDYPLDTKLDEPVTIGMWPKQVCGLMNWEWYFWWSRRDNQALK